MQYQQFTDQNETHRVVVADPSTSYRHRLTGAIEVDGDIQVVGETSSGTELLQLIQQTHPHLVLMELNLEELDGVEVLEQLVRTRLEHRPKILVLTGFTGNAIPHLLSDLGVDYYLVKPCSPERVCRRIRQLTQSSEHQAEHSSEAERQVSTVLQSMGMPAHIQGYQFLRWSILSVMDDPDLLRGVTKLLYPMVARQFYSTPQRVERSIRHAINTAWLRGDIDIIDNYFGHTISSRRGKPTNSEFIAMIADRLRLERKIY